MEQPIPQIIPLEKLETYSRRFVEEFIKKAKSTSPIDIAFSFYPNRTAYEAETGHAFVGPVYSENQGNGFTIHVCEENLGNISSLALQGWMEHEAMHCIQNLNGKYSHFNYKRNIFPLMPVTGLAENHLLELTQSIEKGIRNYIVTKSLTHAGRGVQQAHFYFFSISPKMEDRQHYQETLPHLWTKALFICRKFREFMPIFCLAETGVDFSRDLLDYWSKAHDYLTPEDRMFLDHLAGIPHRYEASSYAEIVTKIFKGIKSQYLLSPKDTAKGTPPPTNLH